MNAAALRARLSLLATEPPPIGGDDARGYVRGKLTPAAVLVPIVLGPAPSILLTKRTSHLARHAGQVSFPGGRIDPEDPHPEAAALREAEEEIALAPHHVELAGRLGEYITGTGYAITPVVGFVPAGLAYTPSPHEVEDVFELPISVVLDPAAPTRQTRYSNGSWREFWVWPHERHFIWGATAGILVHLAGFLRAEI